MTPRQRLRQSRTKFRLIAARDFREAEKTGVVRGNYGERAILDAIQTAYAAGLRDGHAISSQEPSA